ncbi:MAG: acyl-ACP--UDP-N-acetylglucosamine O-acyltransferase [Bdellovibrionales bacterium]|nr:acyl-ACP--UDP-N-acetylglucosamine O-acyltransferase [Bdellovibrionales bacterium]
MSVHPTAIVSEKAKLHETVTVGPYAIIKGAVDLGANCEVHAHAILGSEYGRFVAGEGNIFHSGAAVGGSPQDLKYANEETTLEIGDKNTFREFTTVNIGTPSGGGKTTIGSNCLFMAYVHVAHDCHLGNHVIIANSSNLAGHVTIEDGVGVGGVCQFNQFVRLGRYSYIAGDSAVNKDVTPFAIAQGKYAVIRATNKIKLERMGFEKPEIDNIHKAIRFLSKGNRSIDEALKAIAEECIDSENIQHLTSFVKNSERGIAL